MNEKFLEVGDVMQILGISRSAAYKLMRQINSELEKKGYIVIRGKVSRKYFEERIYGMSDAGYTTGKKIETEAGAKVIWFYASASAYGKKEMMNMPAYKDSKTGTWFVKFYCKDWTGENKQIKKRGFATKREALDYERNYKIRQENNLDMTFGEFWKLYSENVKNYVKLNT